MGMNFIYFFFKTGRSEMAAARCFSSDSFPKVLYNWKDYLLYITDKDEMPDFTILNHTKLL